MLRLLASSLHASGSSFPHRFAFHIFPLKEKYNCLTAERISKPHAGNTVQFGSDVICEQYLFTAIILRATKISIKKIQMALPKGSMKHRQGHCLVHRLRHIGIALPESCPDRAIVKTKGFSCLFSLGVSWQVANVIALCTAFKASFKEDKPPKDVKKPLK